MIEIVEGNALDVLDQLAEKISDDKIWANIPFDFVFLDADKENLMRKMLYQVSRSGQIRPLLYL